jgi:hypothetical protein
MMFRWKSNERIKNCSTCTENAFSSKKLKIDSIELTIGVVNVSIWVLHRN